MTDPKAANPGGTPNAGGPFDGLEIPGLDGNSRTSSDSNASGQGQLGFGTGEDARGFVILSEEEVSKLQSEQGHNIFLRNISDELELEGRTHEARVFDIQKDVKENSAQIENIAEQLSKIESTQSDFQSVTSELDHIEDQLESLVTSEELSEEVRQATSDEVNKRIVGPLLFGTAFILLAAAVGALFTGSWWISVLLLPLPLLTGYYLWKSKDL